MPLPVAACIQVKQVERAACGCDRIFAKPNDGEEIAGDYNAGDGRLCLAVEDLDPEFERLRGRVDFQHPEPVEIPWGPYKGGKACICATPTGSRSS
jgi:hypothetical protein